VYIAANMAAEPAAPYRPVPGWPSGAGGVAFGAVSAVATDSSDRVVVFHRGETPVVVFERDGTFVRAWGKGLVKKAHGLRIDRDDNVWITDVGDHLVHKLDRDGKLLLTLGKKGVPGDGPNRFNKPTDVAVTPSGAFYVSDGYGNSRVVKFSKDGQFLAEWGRKGRGEGEFNLPHAVCLDARDRLLVGDRENDRVQLFNLEGKFVAQWNEGGAPFGLFPSRDGNVFVADGRAHHVTVLDREGKRIERFGAPGSAPGQFALPHAVCVDSHGDVYVAEIDGKRVQKFSRK
jgi:DNA-binding beta-propeller fold protein YncE